MNCCKMSADGCSWYNRRSWFATSVSCSGAKRSLSSVNANARFCSPWDRRAASRSRPSAWERPGTRPKPNADNCRPCTKGTTNSDHTPALAAICNNAAALRHLRQRLAWQAPQYRGATPAAHPALTGRSPTRNPTVHPRTDASCGKNMLLGTTRVADKCTYCGLRKRAARTTSTVKYGESLKRVASQ